MGHRREGGQGSRNRLSLAQIPSRRSSTPAHTPDAQPASAITSRLPRASSLQPPTPGEGRASGPRVLQLPPESPAPAAGAAGTYLQPGFLVAATPSDAPAASAGTRQPYRSCIASKMPIRCHRSGA